jgi:hypothetical protein
MLEAEIPDAKNLGLCREYPQVYMIGYGCRKFLLLWLTGFCGRSWTQPDGGMLQREVLKARPQAEQAQSRSASGGPQSSEDDLDGAQRAVQSKRRVTHSQ